MASNWQVMLELDELKLEFWEWEIRRISLSQNRTNISSGTDYYLTIIDKNVNATIDQVLSTLGFIQVCFSREGRG